jgi:hypothetical protein
MKECTMDNRPAENVTGLGNPADGTWDHGMKNKVLLITFGLLAVVSLALPFISAS